MEICTSTWSDHALSVIAAMAGAAMLFIREGVKDQAMRVCNPRTEEWRGIDRLWLDFSHHNGRWL